MKLPLTVIIPAADDLRLEDCVKSIDEDVEVLVSLNGPTEEIKELVKRLKLKHCEIPQRNLGAALDEGIKKATYNKVLFMDSDCTFKKGTIRKLFNGLKKEELSKGVVVFERKGFVSKIIADIRDYTTSGEPSAYKPPLGMRKSIIRKIGYYFDRDIHWEEDDELNDRVKRAKVRIEYMPSAKIFHPQLTIKTDLRSAYRYGTGRRIGVEKGLFSLNIFRYIDFAVFWKKSPVHFLYLLLWNISYFLGYLSQKYFNVQKVKLEKNL